MTTTTEESLTTRVLTALADGPKNWLRLQAKLGAADVPEIAARLIGLAMTGHVNIGPGRLSLTAKGRTWAKNLGATIPCDDCGSPLSMPQITADETSCIRCRNKEDIPWRA